VIELTTSRKKAIDANILVHSSLASSGEYNRSPHFRSENQQKVRKILEGLIKKEGQQPYRLLDLGCGTGFIIHLVHDLVDEVQGVDITDEMMSLIDLSPGNIQVQNSIAEETPFEDEFFNMVTAYSFLDHLTTYEDVIVEACRVLKPGGIFYSDLNPNRHFSNCMESLESYSLETLPEVVSREIAGMLHNGEYWENNFGIDKEAITNAEPIKSFDKGFDPDEVSAFAKKTGFSDVSFEYDWFLGQGVLMHEHSQEKADTVDEYLRFALPATRGLFKYIRFVFIK
jgi:ubiquinone/menaquinone biosynthesis C-methylase UbiE